MLQVIVKLIVSLSNTYAEFNYSTFLHAMV